MYNPSPPSSSSRGRDDAVYVNNKVEKGGEGERERERVVVFEPKSILKPHPQLRGLVGYAQRVGEKLLSLNLRLRSGGDGEKEKEAVAVPARVYVFFHGVWLLTWALVVLLVVRLFPKLKLWRVCSHKRYFA